MENHPDYEQQLRPLLAGDSGVIQALFDRCFPPMLALVKRGGGSRQDAEDVFMNSLEVLCLLTRRPGFCLTSTLSTLLYGIGRLQWLKIAEKKRRIQRGTNELKSGSIESADVLEAMYQAERYQLYREKFTLLSAECQKLLLMSFQNHSNSAVASEMGFSNEAYYRKRKHLCKNRLIRMIRQDRRFEELKHDHDQ